MPAINNALVYRVETMVSQNKDDAPKGIVRIPASLIDGSKVDKANKFFRRELVTLVNRENDRRVVRHVVGGNREYDLTPGKAAIDYEARDGLLIRRLDQGVNVEIVRATLLDRWWYYWNSDDPAMRIANRMGLLAFVISLKPEVVDLVVWVAGLFR